METFYEEIMFRFWTTSSHTFLNYISKRDELRKNNGNHLLYKGMDITINKKKHIFSK